MVESIEEQKGKAPFQSSFKDPIHEGGSLLPNYLSKVSFSLKYHTNNNWLWMEFLQTITKHFSRLQTIDKSKFFYSVCPRVVTASLVLYVFFSLLAFSLTLFILLCSGCVHFSNNWTLITGHKGFLPIYWYLLNILTEFHGCSSIFI